MSEMTPFTRKRKYSYAEYKALFDELTDTKHKLEMAEKDKHALMAKLGALDELNDSTPEDCERGSWCEVCEFNRTFVYRERTIGFGGMGESYIRVRGSACGKGKSCPNFVQRSVEE